MSTSENIDDILKYYSSNQESQRHVKQQLEFALMERVIQTYLSKKPLRILELGAGSGYYTKKLAEIGHQIVAVDPVLDLLKQNQDFCKQNSVDDKVQWINCDARDLKSHVKGVYDLVLNMGPFYHLIQAVDRSQVLQESKTLLDDQGLIMSVFLSRSGYLSYVLAHQPESIVQDPEGFRDIMTQGFDSRHPRDGSFRGYFADLGELTKFHQDQGFQIQKLHVLDPVIGGVDEVFNRLSDDLKSIWADILYAFSSDPQYWNTGRTWLVLATKTQ